MTSKACTSSAAYGYRRTGRVQGFFTFTMDREATVMHCTSIIKSLITLRFSPRPFRLKLFKLPFSFATNTAVLTFHAHYSKLSFPVIIGHLFVLASIFLW